MDEYLFITLAKLKADRLRLAREDESGQLPLELAEPVETPRPPVFATYVEGAVMRTTVTLAVAVAISLTTLAALEWSANRTVPAGEVTITQIEEG